MFAKQRYNIMRNIGLSVLLVTTLLLATTITTSAQNACGGLMIFDSSDSSNVPGTCVGSAADAEFYQGAAGDCSGADSYTQQLVSSPTTINGDPIMDATHSIQTYDRVTSAFGPGVAPPTTMPNNKEILLQASGSSSNVYRFNVPEAVLEQSDTSRIRIDVPNPSDTVIVNVLGGGPKLVGASGFGGGGFGAWTNNGIVSTDAYSEQTANNTPYNNATQYMRTFFDHDPQKLIFNFPDATVQDFVQLGEWTSNFYGTYLAPCGDIQMKNVGHNFLGAVIADGSFGWSANNYNLPDNTPFTGETVGTAQAVADVGVMKTADVETTAEGGTVVWTIVVENTGTISTTGGVTVADTLGANHTIVSADPAPTNGTTWELPDMVPGEMVTITVTTTADEGSGGTAITNDVTVTTEGDSDDTNNSSGDSVDVAAVPLPDVAVIKTADVATTAEGGTVVWTIIVENVSDVTTTGGVTVTDTVGPNHTVVSADPAPTNGTTWVLPDMGPGETAVIQVTTMADAGSGGSTITNDVTVDTTGDSDDTNNSDGTSVTVTEVIVGTIGDTIYHDMNGNGMQDAGEPGLGGVMVTVTDSAGMTHTATTDSDGMYTITDLPLGTTTVVVDPMSLPEDKGNASNTGDPDGGNDNMSTIELTETEPSSNMQDFGYASGSIGDTIYHDMNGNGMQDDGEPGLDGVMVTVTDSGGMTWTATTDTDGMYMFTDLPLDTYTIEVDPMSLPEDKGNAANTGDPDGGNDNMSTADLTTDPSDADQDFGYASGSIGDTIYHDMNGNGMQDDGEPGLGGVMVTIMDSDGMTWTMETDSDGMYMFTNVPLGAYSVMVDDTTLPDDKMDANNTGDPDDGNDSMSDIVLTMTDPSNDMQDFGYNLTILGSIGDMVYHDENGNGMQDNGELGLGDVMVTITGPDNVPQSMTTGPDGMYEFTDLPMGDYTVAIDTTSLPDDKMAGTNSGDPDGGNDGMAMVSLTAEMPENDMQDFGYVSGSIGDTVWHDANGNGVQDADEPGIPNVVVELSNGDTATTDADGMYMFDGLPMGDYTVTIDETTLPMTKTAGSTAVGGDTIMVTLGELRTVVITGTVTISMEIATTDVITADFGYEPLGSIGDLIWSESITNSNSTFEASDGDMPLPNVTVILSAPGMDTMTMTTDADGLYMFTDLPLGEYTVTVDRTTLPENKQDMDTTQVTADPDGGADATSIVTLNGENVDDTEQDFGFLDGSPTAVGLSSMDATSNLFIATIAMTMMLGATLFVIVRRN